MPLVKSGQIVEEARRRQVLADGGGVSAKIVLLIAIEHRHRQQQCTAPAAERGLPQRRASCAAKPRRCRREESCSAGSRCRRTFDHGDARRRFEVRILTGCAADADAVDAGPNQHVDQPIEGGLVEPAIVANRCRHRSKESLYRQMCHA